MRQLTLVSYGKAAEAFELRESPTPNPEPGQLLIEVEGFGLNFADVMARQGLYREAPRLPFVPGYEVVGKVLTPGAGVSNDWLGRRVVAFCRFGGYSDHALVDHRAAGVIPECMPPGEACALATQYCTAYYMTDYSNKLRTDETALIHAAAGGVGTALVQLCRRKGIFTIGLCGSVEKLAYLREIGVDLPICYKEQSYPDVIEGRLGKRKVDYVFNTSMGKSFRVDRKLLNYGGKLFCFGGASRSGSKGYLVNDLSFLFQTGFLSPLFMMMQSQSIMGVNMLRLADHRVGVIGACLRELIDLHTAGEVHPQVGGTFSAAEIASAHEMLESGKSMGKIYVHWT
ncbi:MAG: zinc-binding dehydrogenase [Lunatimonas sp.]|uniref:quinone oxidoreductase family protein n=1 Tax=Lunatimonas sp. TaxID=2060141 RepID=UPI00263BCE1D|nr:zinc-binding dehydrogenase [Lunatimonas sp.]MCC5937175.1 zinc-binding dehydrogenase [Lunatimonas sp.]